jgi:hypothetical protein
MPSDRCAAALHGRWSGLLLLLAAVGCSPSDSTQPSPPPVANGRETSEVRSSPSRLIAQPTARDRGLGTPPSDRSLDMDSYIAMGIPAPDRVWNSEDMARVADVLTKLAAKDAGRLPRFKSQRSGRLYDRITSSEDLAQFRDRSLPIDVRLPRVMDYLNAANSLLKLYYSHFVKHDVGDDDMVGLFAIVLQTTAVACPLLGEFVPTLDKNDPSYATRMQGLETRTTRVTRPGCKGSKRPGAGWAGSPSAAW